MAPEVRDHDPRTALDGGPDGLDAYRVIAGQLAAPPWAARLGDRPVVLEIGAAQAAAVTAIMAAVGFRRVALRDDYGGGRVAWFFGAPVKVIISQTEQDLVRIKTLLTSRKHRLNAIGINSERA